MNSNQSKPKVTDFYDLVAWQESIKLTTEIYKLCLNFPKTELFGIVDQLKRAVTSISANIAEGFGRFTYKDRLHFFYQSRGSLKEVQNFLLISKELGFINQSQISIIWEKSKSCEMLLNGLIKSCQNYIT